MLGLLSILTFLGAFVWLGMTQPTWDGATRRRLLVSIAIVMLLVFIGINLFWETRPYGFSSQDRMFR